MEGHGAMDIEKINKQCPHGYEYGDHHWFKCMKVSPFWREEETVSQITKMIVEEYYTLQYLTDIVVHGKDWWPPDGEGKFQDFDTAYTAAGIMLRERMRQEMRIVKVTRRMDFGMPLKQDDI